MSNTSRGGMSEAFKNEQMQALIGKAKSFFEDPNITARAGGQEIVTEFLDKLRENEYFRTFCSKLMENYPPEVLPEWVNEMHKSGWSHKHILQALVSAKNIAYRSEELTEKANNLQFGGVYPFSPIVSNCEGSLPEIDGLD
jgi:hypothetical protein